VFRSDYIRVFIPRDVFNMNREKNPTLKIQNRVKKQKSGAQCWVVSRRLTHVSRRLTWSADDWPCFQQVVTFCLRWSAEIPPQPAAEMVSRRLTMLAVGWLAWGGSFWPPSGLVFDSGVRFKSPSLLVYLPLLDLVAMTLLALEIGSRPIKTT